MTLTRTWLALLVAPLLWLAGSASARAEIAIGVAGPLTEQYASFGSEIRAGAQAAIDATNAAGGINGEQLVLVPADDGCDTRQAATAARDLIAKDVRLVVGHFCAGAAQAAAVLYGDAGILMISPAATLPALTDQGGWNVFRTTVRDDAQADLAAARLGADQKLVVVADGLPSSKALVARLQAAGKAAAVVPSAQADAALVDAVKAAGATVVYLAAGPAEAARVLGVLRGAGVALPLWGSDNLLADEFLARLPAGENQLFATFPADPQSRLVDAGAKAKLTASGAEGAVLPAYAAVQAFVAAAKATSVNDGKAMATWLHAGNSVATAIGSLSFDAKGDLTSQPFAWYRAANGTFVPDEQPR